LPSSSGVNPRRGEIWLVSLDPTLGDEMQKTRPAVVLSSDEVTTGLELKVIVPITGWKEDFENYAWFVKLTPNKTNGLSKVSGANGLQIRSLSMGRFNKRLGKASPGELADILASVAIVLEIS
jgi:mRNA interferase MazF